VLIHLGYAPEQDQEILEAASAFMGGTLFMGRTCSAFTAGVMAIGLRTGEIEDSPLRVIRLLAIMTVGGNAFDEKINKFNRSMNRGNALSRWFTEEFGSTQCQAITHCDFSDVKGVNSYNRDRGRPHEVQANRGEGRRKGPDYDFYIRAAALFIS
jgi:hypothetical protein